MADDAVGWGQCHGDLNASFLPALTVNMRDGEQWRSGVERGHLRAVRAGGG